MAFSDSNRAPAYIRLADLYPGEVLVVICPCRWHSMPTVPPNQPISTLRFRCRLCNETQVGIYIYDRTAYYADATTSPKLVIRRHTPRPPRQQSC